MTWSCGVNKCVNINANMFMYIFIYVHKYVELFMCIYKFIYIFIYVYICVFIKIVMDFVADSDSFRGLSNNGAGCSDNTFSDGRQGETSISGCRQNEGQSAGYAASDTGVSSMYSDECEEVRSSSFTIKTSI